MALQIQKYAHKNVLLLQGPVGPFFNRLRLDLEAQGSQVYKINFCGGDWLFYQHKAYQFRGDINDWDSFFEDVLEQDAIDVVMLLGDSRLYHRIARKVAKQLSVEVVVFEEGYVRPNYITIEQHGVNGHSQLPKQPEFYRSLPASDKAITFDVKHSFGYSAMWAMIYYAASYLLTPMFSRYMHHRPLSIFEGLFWVEGYWRKYWFRYKERNMLSVLTTKHAKKFFLAPLQISHDSQVLMHSEYRSVKHFIRNVISSFANNADVKDWLVIKHHPLDRGYHDYTQFIQKLAERYNVADRVKYIHDQHLPTLLAHAKGVVLINSTVGMSALHHQCPVKVCGKAIYDMEGLTYQKSLQSFWRDAPQITVDTELFNKFQRYVIAKTQINGNFYTRINAYQNQTGTSFLKD